MYVFRKIWRALFSYNTRLRFTLLPYYRRNVEVYLGPSQISLMELLGKNN